MARIKLEGLDKLQKRLKDNITLDDVKRVVKHNGAQMQEKIQRNADFTKGYATGETKRSIGENLQFHDDGMTVETGPTTEYASYVEYGTRFMEAQPFVRIGYAEQAVKFKADMQKLVR